MRDALALSILDDAEKYADKIKPWTRINFPGNEATTRLYLDSYASYVFIFTGGANYKEIMIVYTGSTGTVTFQTVLNASGFTFATPSDHYLDVTVHNITARQAFVLTLSDSNAPYIVT